MEVGKGKGKDLGEKGKGKDLDRSRSPRRTAPPPAHPPTCRGCLFFQEALSLPPVCPNCQGFRDYITDLWIARRSGLTRQDWETQIVILQEARRALPQRGCEARRPLRVGSQLAAGPKGRVSGPRS